MVELEQLGAGAFLGEPEFELADLLHVERDGSGLISVLELADVQDKPALFSTFMMWMLARLYHDLPEVGDADKPKLVFFFDEAHLLFDGASKAFLDQVQQVVRLVRSKGVGVYFVTQSPKDIPADVLGQLGHRVQHALRAFTPDDEQALKAAARTFPRTEHYDVERTLTSLGIGEALVTVLTPQGTPTMPFATRMIPPCSRMSPLTDDELNERLARSEQVKHYAVAVDPDSARERLLARMAPGPPVPAPMVGTTDTPSPELVVGGALAAIGAAINSPLGRMIAGRVTTQVARGIMGALLGAPSRRRRLF
jgi:DNA helicase HerA-like ATPase